MSRKDFEMIAYTLRAVRPMGPDLEPISNRQWIETVDQFARDLKQLYPRFDTLKFRAACGEFGR